MSQFPCLPSMNYGEMPPLGVRTIMIDVNMIIVIDEYVLSDRKYCVLTVLKQHLQCTGSRHAWCSSANSRQSSPQAVWRQRQLPSSCDNEMSIRPYFSVLSINVLAQHNCGAHRAAISPADIAASSLYRVLSVVPERSFDVSCLRLYPAFTVAIAM